MTDENPYNINKGQYLACPSCGSDVICYSESNDRLVCDSCGCSMRANRWNNRVYPAEVQVAINRDTPLKTINKDQFGVSECPKCKADAQEYQSFCFRCGQRLDWGEE